MKILNTGTEGFYLKSINIIGKQNICLFFRQEHKYVFSNKTDNRFYYKNVILILWMENSNEAEFHCKKIKDLFIDSVLSVEVNEENEIEFYGNQDYKVKVKNYDEDLIDQFIDDWIDRYLMASQSYFDQIERYGALTKLVTEIKKIAEYDSLKKITDLVEEFEKVNEYKFPNE